MSELWTPGQPEQKSSGGIELPKGFTKRREAPPAPDAGDAAPPTTTPDAASSGDPASRAGRQSQFAFPPSGVQVRCPNCGTQFVAPIFSIVDYGLNPELRSALLDGQINVAACTNCGFASALSAPLMVHDPEHKFLGVYVPVQANVDDLQRQRLIGEMTKALMARIPQEQRKGYMLQAQQFLDWDRFTEKLWGFEGVTPEMLRRQRDQANLVQSMLRVADDEAALKTVVARNEGLIAADFFAIIPQIANAYAAQGQRSAAERLSGLYITLLELAPAGAQIKEQRSVVEAAVKKLSSSMSRGDLAAMMVEAWHAKHAEAVVAALTTVARPLVDYEFLMDLAQRIDRTKDPAQKQRLVALRTFVMEVLEQQRQVDTDATQSATALLQAVLEAGDPRAVLQENSADLDSTFLAVLTANIQRAEKKKAKAAVRRLRQIYEMAMSVMEEQMPEDVRLLNRLLSAPDDTATRRLLQENRALLTRDFVDQLKILERQWRQEGRPEIADRAKSLRGKVSLML